MSSASDVCVPSNCASKSLGTSTYCSKACPCGHGGGDCDSDAQCMPGLVCDTDVGEGFAMSAATDVCVPKDCAVKEGYTALGEAGYCSVNCPCGPWGGLCVRDNECMPGLECISNYCISLELR